MLEEKGGRKLPIFEIRMLWLICNRQDGGMTDIPDIWHSRLSLTPRESVKLTQVAINSPPMQPCIVWSCMAMGSANLLHLTGTNKSMKIFLLNF